MVSLVQMGDVFGLLDLGYKIYMFYIDEVKKWKSSCCGAIFSCGLALRRPARAPTQMCCRQV
jgi:hypothetical protein